MAKVRCVSKVIRPFQRRWIEEKRFVMVKILFVVDKCRGVHVECGYAKIFEWPFPWLPKKGEELDHWFYPDLCGCSIVSTGVTRYAQDGVICEIDVDSDLDTFAESVIKHGWKCFCHEDGHRLEHFCDDATEDDLARLMVTCFKQWGDVDEDYSHITTQEQQRDDAFAWYHKAHECEVDIRELLKARSNPSQAT